MNLVKKEIKTYKVHMMCDCGGEYKMSESDLFNMMFLNEGYRHTCDKCGKVMILSEYYPREVRGEE